jgi:hypothetical protein
VIAGLLQSTSLPFVVAATEIGLGLGVVSQESADALVTAGLLTVVISPTVGSVLLRRRPARETGGGNPSTGGIKNPATSRRRDLSFERKAGV